MLRGVAVLALLGATAAADPLSDLLAKTPEIARAVSKQRGLPLKRPIPNEVLDKDAMRARLLKETADPKAAREATESGQLMIRFGLLPAGTDYTAMMVDVLTEQIAGFYDPDTKALAVATSAGEDETWAEVVLSHELDHGIQDQNFDLKKFEDVPDGESDADMARHALVEGDGVALMLEVLVGKTGGAIDWSNPALVAALTSAMSEPDDDKPGPGGKSEKLDKAPLAVREAMLFPYRAGLVFVAGLRAHHSWRAVDAAFRRAPRSTEQILHVAKYLADEKPIVVGKDLPASLHDYPLVTTSVMGELGYSIWFRAHGVDEAPANTAAAGWGGDRTLLFAATGETRPDHMIGLARSAWDTEADAIEAEAAAAHALDASALGAIVEKDDTHARFVTADGTTSWVERRGKQLVVVIGAPAAIAPALADDAWVGLPKAKRHR
ncbi:MAG TPA: hypothetical protein VGM88_34735 [Kofleriaceae bacterium]|jgi:hypothetical protein